MNKEMSSTLERFLNNRTPQTHASGPAAAFSGAATDSSTPAERKAKQVSAQLGASTKGCTVKSDQLIKEKGGAF